MLNDACILAPALAASDLTIGDLLAMAGFPAADIARERGNLLRRWRRAGWIEDFGVRLSGRTWHGEGGDLGRDIFTALHGSFVGAPTVQMLAEELQELDANGQASRALERAVEAGVDDGWLLPVRAIRLTAPGVALVSGDVAAVEIAIAEQRARQAAREFARLTDAEAAGLARMGAETRAVLALAEATRGAPVPRARPAEGREVRGLPGRTVPARFQHRGETQ